MGVGGHLVEVELDDELVDEPRPPRTPWTARAWSRVAVVVAVALAIAAGGHAAQAATWGERYLGSGFAADLTVPRHELWSRDRVTPIGAAGDLLLVASTADSEGVRALRLADGTPVWSHDGGYCSLLSLDERGSPLSAVYDLERSRVQCDSWDGSRNGSVFLDPRDGSVLLDLPTAGDERQITPVGDLVVVTDRAADRTVTVSSLVTGEQLWRTVLDAMAGDVVATADQVQVIGTLGADDLAFDLATGAREEPVDGELGQPAYTQVLADGTVVQNTVPASGSPEVVVIGPDGAERWSRPGWSYPPSADDHQDGGVVLVSAITGTASEALDARTGEVLWSSDGWVVPVIRTRGALVVLVQDVLSSGMPEQVVVDERTGAELWRADGDGLAGWQIPVSDGRTVGFAVRDGDEARMAVRDVLTGEQVSSWPLPRAGDSALITLPGGLLVQYGSTGLAVLGP